MFFNVKCLSTVYMVCSKSIGKNILQEESCVFSYTKLKIIKKGFLDRFLVENCGNLGFQEI